MNQLRHDLPPLPERFRGLPVDARGYPVPFFVGWVDGVPDFRVVDGRKLRRCIKERVCWLCGQALGRHLAWVIGPMCAINRVSSEPPQHLECADFAARACPFLTRPGARRRAANMPEHDGAAGEMIARNPGVALVWVARDYKLHRAGGGGSGVLFQVGESTELRWYCEGRRALPSEVHASIYSGLPILIKMAQSEGKDAETALASQIAAASKLLPRVA